MKMPPEWTYSPGASLANQSARQGDDLHKTTPDGSGPSLHDSFAYFDQEEFCWKTSQASLLPDSETSSVTWPRAGTTLNGIAYRRQPLAPRTSATAFSSSLHHGPNSDGIWPTATTQDHGTRYAQGGMPLGMAARLWPTPTSSDSTGGPGGKRGGGNNLRTEVRLWPTPIARDWKGPTGKSNWNSVPDDRDRGNLSTPAIQRRAAKGKQLNLSMVVSKESGQLNPQWVEWLMGFPTGWTDLEL